MIYPNPIENRVEVRHGHKSVVGPSRLSLINEYYKN